MHQLMNDKHILLSGLLVFLACGTPAPDPSTAPTQDTLSTSASVHDTVSNVFEEQGVKWIVPEAARWDTMWWRTYGDSTGTLSHRRADLDGDGRMDEAFVVERRADTAYVVAIRVSLATGKDTLLEAYQSESSIERIGFGLMIEPPGEIHHLGGDDDAEEIPSPTRTNASSLTAVYFEKSAITWFWKDGRFHQVWTGD